MKYFHALMKKQQYNTWIVFKQALWSQCNCVKYAETVLSKLMNFVFSIFSFFFSKSTGYTGTWHIGLTHTGSTNVLEDTTDVLRQLVLYWKLGKDSQNNMMRITFHSRTLKMRLGMPGSYKYLCLCTGFWIWL